MLTKEMQKEVLGLKPEDRILMAELIYESLDKTDEQIEKIWVRESEERYKAYKNGQIRGVPLEDIKMKFEK